MSTVARLFIPSDIRSKGIISAFLGTLLISFDPVFVRFSGTGGFNTAFLFGLFTAISMSVMIQSTDKRGLMGTLKASGWPVLFSGLLMLGSASSFILSIKNTAVSNTVVIMASAPVMTAVFSRLFLQEKTRRTTWIAISVVFAGILVVVNGSLQAGNLFGDLMALSAVTFVSANQTLLRKFKDVSRLASVGMGGFFLALVMLFLAEPSTFSTNTWLVMAMMGLLSAPFGRVLNQTATRYILVPEVAMIALINTVFAPLWAFSFFGEKPALNTVAGGGIILMTILIYISINIQRSRKAARQ